MSYSGSSAGWAESLIQLQTRQHVKQSATNKAAMNTQLTNPPPPPPPPPLDPHEVNGVLDDVVVLGMGTTGWNSDQALAQEPVLVIFGLAQCVVQLLT